MKCLRSSHLQPRRKSPGPISAFTLLEVMIAAMVLIFVFVSTLTALQAGFRLIESARNTTLADQIIQSQIEDIRLCSWARLETLQVADAAAVPTGKLTLSSDLEGQYTAIRTITNMRGNTMKRINIQVSWKSYTGRIYTRSYETLFTHYGVTDYFVTNRS